MSIMQSPTSVAPARQQTPGPWVRNDSQPKRTQQKQSFDQEFNAYYDQHIKQPVEDYFKPPSNKKLSPLEALILCLFSLAVAVGGNGLWVKTGKPIDIASIIMITGLVSLFVFCPTLLVYLNVKSLFRRTPIDEPVRSMALNSIIIPKIFSFLDNGCVHSKKAVLTEQDVMMLGIGPGISFGAREDEVNGIRNSIPFKMMELKLTDRNFIFRCVYLLLDIPKTFNGRVDIKYDAGIISNALSKKRTNIKRVRLEDPEFEKVFEVYADSQTEARYLLTTTMMQCLKDLRSVFGGDSLQASFYQGKLMLLIDCPHNLFEIHANHDNAEAFREEAKLIIGDLNSIFRVIDAMELNRQSIL